MTTIFSNKESTIILAAMYGNPLNPNFSLNASELNTLSDMSNGAFTKHKKELVAKGYFQEVKKGYDKFYFLNWPYLFSDTEPPENIRYIERLAHAPEIREVFFNPKKYTDTNMPHFSAYMLFIRYMDNLVRACRFDYINTKEKKDFIKFFTDKMPEKSRKIKPTSLYLNNQIKNSLNNGFSRETAEIYGEDIVRFIDKHNQYTRERLSKK